MSDGIDTPAQTVADAANTGAAAETAVRDRIDYEVSDLLCAYTDPRHAKSESIGALRTHLLAQHIRDGRRALAISSPSAGVGTSYVSANLAASFAQAGMKTLLIDANMRDPSLEDYIRPSAPVIGLQHCLMDPNLRIGDAIQQNVLPNLSIVYAGGQADDPQMLLASDSFKITVEDCLRDFDITIIDTPPSNGSSDARRIALVVKYAMLISRRDVTFMSDLKTLVDEFTNDRVKIIGTYLNSF
ncbi:CpsD/CapB family tyrosine-protein kinase [Sphingobium sufflavum]|uniref:CpsD/CapB family tyrosine-protein kinase n=1 Tax=Sphingobium sufflavum TaxID=1129547 RepID=UPI001F3723FA|nr:CpsD/CapB family tyrosine-protein kinase [Sphingobium sufflavum]MCE7798526.1 CpsD/CapB family tyrosine-protein kinase [Sphingobium sufflavum]